MSDALRKAGLDELRAIAEGHVASGFVPGLVVLVSSAGQTHVEALGPCRSTMARR